MADSKEKLTHLLKLLDDDSPEIQKIIFKELHANALELILRKSAYKNNLQRKNQENLDNLLKNYHLGLVLAAFEELIGATLEDIDLEKANFVISYWSDSKIDCLELKNKLDEMSRSIMEIIPNTGHPLAFLDHISHHLFREFRIRGNTTDYYNPNNSYLHKLLETKKGIPITIGILYILISKRLGLPVYGVSMPGHFILKFYDEEDEVFFDPFYEGKIYSRQMCYDFLRRANMKNSEEILNGCSNYEIVVRVLKNLHLVYSSYEHEPERLKQIESFLEIFESRYVNKV